MKNNLLINGQWSKAADVSKYTLKNFRNSISSAESSQFNPEKDRYHLYVSHACPWSHRTVIMRTLKKLEDIISISYVDTIKKDDGWTFGMDSKETQDPINNFKYLHEVYSLSDHQFTGRVSVPVLWDKRTQQIVNNESSDIMRFFNSEFKQFSKGADYDYYPSKLSSAIDKINESVYAVNISVYHCGLTKDRVQYETALEKLFQNLDHLDLILEKNQFLLGDQITEADWRLFVTLIRFDQVYFDLFKCNRKKIQDYKNLPGFVKELYRIPGIKETINFDQIIQHYYKSFSYLNSDGLIPQKIIPPFLELKQIASEIKKNVSENSEKIMKKIVAIEDKLHKMKYILFSNDEPMKEVTQIIQELEEIKKENESINKRINENKLISVSNSR